MILLRTLRAVTFDSVLVRLLPTALLFVVALVVAVVVPEFELLDGLAVWLSCVFMALAVVLAVLYSLRPNMHWVQLVPLVAMLAIAVARVGIGSFMTPVLVLPIIWLATSEGVRWVVVAGLAAVGALALEFTWPGASVGSIEGMLSVVFTPLALMIVAATVNRIAGENRRSASVNEQLTRQRESMLDEAVDLVGQLRANEAQLKENEGRLQASGHLLRSVLDSVSRQSVIGTDLTGLIDVWNTGAETILGLRAKEAVGWRHIHEFHRGEELDDRARELGYPAGATVLNPGFSALVEYARLGGSEDRDWHYVRDDGSATPVHVTVTPRVDENGRTVGYIFVGTDISERKELSRLQDEFVGLVSHELRTPISSILGYLELMRDDTDAPLSDEQRHYLGVAERNAHRLLRLVGDLLFTAQVTAHKFPIEAAEVDVNALVEAAVESARPVSKRGNVLLLSKPAAAAPIVHGDATRIAQACDNLLSNAIKFTPRGGTVTVSVSVTSGAEGSFARVAVRDTGMGIPPDEIAQLSTRFFRASTATRSAVQGVGLGLSITKAIVTAHGGELSADSEVGVGTTFAFTLPLLRVGETESDGRQVHEAS
ncbi:PAS domain-containing sensor histidine kinase [Homoserinimonas aerilata]|nr:ATP-binding protein [Homoserinimonas aerilata]